MNSIQAKGYIFESVILKLLQKSGYINIRSSVLRGRGAYHQIDAYGIFSIPTPFIYPLRLICETKCYKNSIKLPHIRNFVGVMKDISENYIIGEHNNRNTPDRYTDAGCFFGAGSFTIPAQEYAWAHNIFIVSFHEIPLLKPIVNKIKSFVNDKRNLLRNMSIDIVRKTFWERYSNDDNINNATLDVGILDGVYPIILVGKNEWIKKVDNITPLEREEIEATKINRIDYEYDTRFNLSVGGQNIYFVLPKSVANKIINRINITKKGGKIFDIEIPFISSKGKNRIRRYFKINIILPEIDKNVYLNELLCLKDSIIVELRDKKGNKI